MKDLVLVIFFNEIRKEMKIRLLDYKHDEYFVEIPDDTDEITIKVISGDMVMTSPVRYDTSDVRMMNYYDGEFTLHRNDFHFLDKIRSTCEFMSVMYGGDLYEQEDLYEEDEY